MITGKGIPASPGIVIGSVYVYREAAIGNPRARKTPFDANEETRRLDDAIRNAEKELMDLMGQGDGGKERNEILNSHLCILRDPEIAGEARKAIADDSLFAEDAIGRSVAETASIFADMDDDPYLRERAKDIEDVGERILRNLAGVKETNLSNLPPGTVIVAKDLKPSDTARIDRANVIGFAVDSGGETSHTAILAKAMNLVAVVGIGNITSSVADGDRIILDGSTGIAIVNPSPETITDYLAKRDRFLRLRERLLAAASTECVDRNGKKILVAANIGNPEDVSTAVENGADAIGLFRTEFLYLDRESEPDEEEQFKIYSSVLSRAGGRPVIVRTLDIGGDKDVPYLNLPKEDNPFLGMRALRLCLAMPELFRTQLRALLRASVSGELGIMFPMIQSVEELETAKTFLADCARELDEEGLPRAKNVKTGVMIEIPAAALIADELAARCDFFSIGTNDLTQYTLAVDRGNETVAYLYDSFHPAVLALIKRSIEAAHRQGIPCGMCGEFAGNPEAIPILLDYGLDEFSMSAAGIPAAKEAIRSRESCRSNDDSDKL
jgi:phosphoenolpyruvate-protein phosphotransferase (PTS system enzyme I)